MTKSETEKKYSLIAAICYTVYVLYCIINAIVFVLQYDYATITAWDIIFWIPSISMAVALFMKNKKAVVVAAGIKVLYNACYFFFYVRHLFSDSKYFLYDCVYFLWKFSALAAYISAVVLIILSIKCNSIVKKIWFLPSVVLISGCIIHWITNHYFFMFSHVWDSMLFSILECVALLFVGMWIKEGITASNTAPVNKNATFNSQTVYSATASSAIGGADKLKMYKNLLDSGVITQEEFEAKKKEILGL